MRAERRLAAAGASAGALAAPPAHRAGCSAGGAGESPGSNSSTRLTGTSAPLRPRGSVMTTCSGAQSPVMFGSPLGRRAARGAAGAAVAAGFESCA